MRVPAFVLVFWVALAASAQEIRPVTATLNEVDRFVHVKASSVDHSKLENFLEKLTKKRGTLSEAEFVAYIFQKTHQVFLKRYVLTTSLPLLFTDGSYNCLTGTILYSILLNHFEIPHDVIETNYHIFIVVEADDHEILMEATDPLHGLVTEPAEVQKRLETYRRNSVAASGTEQYHFNCNLYNRVSSDNLVGLLFYNLSIEAFNRQDFARAVSHLSESVSFYSSPRTQEFAVLLSHAVHENETLTPEEKAKLVRNLRHIRARSQQTLAGLQP